MGKSGWHRHLPSGHLRGFLGFGRPNSPAQPEDGMGAVHLDSPLTGPGGDLPNAALPAIYFCLYNSLHRFRSTASLTGFILIGDLSALENSHHGLSLYPMD
ncbi:hypothetical protein GDO86_009999 [Hymenochirus boettgeri]|uniref:Uncharacterized protein n=1 Tax=Hymenochirus boettgeri TaxID=247094 RepID=A0A8T2JNM0_9PIPI|nr:hypothetical protein GDO86_009999 [Hymenochirus boettgeri]